MHSILSTSRQFRLVRLKNQAQLLAIDRTFSVKVDILNRIRDSSRAGQVAVQDAGHSLVLTYRQLDEESTKLANHIQSTIDLNSSKTIGIFNKPTINFVVSLLATWKLDKVAVPLCTSHTFNELLHVISDSDVRNVLVTGVQDIPSEIISKLPTKLVTVPELLSPGNTKASHLMGSQTNPMKKDKDAVIVYTSGTTGRPKGVVHTHSSLHHMIDSLVNAWEYNNHDKLLHFLPLYHVHGLMNKLLCVLYVGGCVEFLPSALPQTIWERLAKEETQLQQPLTMFHAVPTVYAKLLEYARNMDDTTKLKAIKAMRKMRFMACGSAPLPDVVMDNWKALTGHTLLERYGMTELGMALSNPYKDEAKENVPIDHHYGRRKGYVGFPLPHVKASIVDEHGQPIKTADTPGELLISVSE
jgi:malonyl-CoA/methylmalonyl-CoA synthetase